MRIKQKFFLLSVVLGLFVGFGTTLVAPAPSAMAYTCSHSGANKDGKQGQYQLQMEGNGGSCYYMQPDKRDNSKKETINGVTSCTGGTVMHDDDDCWTYKKTYTAYKPTYDNGTEINNDVFQTACQRMPTYYGSHYNYNEDLNACSAGAGCSKVFGDDGSAQGSATGIIGTGDCRRVGYGTAGAGDVLGADPTNPQNQTPDDPKTCDDGNKPDSSGNCKDGSTPQTASQRVDKPAGKDTNLGTCGTHGTDNDDVETVLIGCDKQACGTTSGQGDFKGVPVITCILKYGISALTVLVGVGAVAGIAWEAVQYARAQDDQSIVSSARRRIRDIVIGLGVYVFMIAVINWLIPGGIIP